VLVGYNAIHVPQERAVRLSREQAAEEQATQRMQAEVAALLAEAEQYRKPLAEEPDPAALVRDVVELAQQSGVQLTSISHESPQELPQFTQMTVRLHGTASYHQLGTFLDALERAERFLRVERFEISRAAYQQAAAIELVVSTLYVPPILSGSGAASH